MPKLICTIPDCGKFADSRGLCPMHYRRAQRSGTLPPKLTNEDRFWAKVNKTDECWEWTAFKDRDGYGKFMAPGVPQYAHRASWHYLRGPVPGSLQIDHLCHNRACVNPDHLRLATNAENQQNLRGARRISKSGALGVCWREDAQKWHVTIKHQGKSRHVGYYVELADAEAASSAARSAAFTHFQTE